MIKQAAKQLLRIAIVLMAIHYAILLTSRDKTGEAGIGQTAKAGLETSPSLVHQPLHDQKYFCSMHPSVVTTTPGKCPVCQMDLQPMEPSDSGRKILFYRHPMGKNETSPVPAKDEMGMDYIPVYAEEDIKETEGTVQGRATFSLPNDAQQRIGVTTGKVEELDLQYDIRASGRVVFDPELYTAVRDLEAANKLARGSVLPNTAHGPSESLLSSALTKLKLLGLNDNQIADLRTGRVSADQYLLPKGRVWIYADVYESEIASIKIGQSAKIEAPGLPHGEFDGVIAGINPVLDPATRTLKVRIEVSDPHGILTPEAFVSVTIHVALGKSLAISEDAVIHTGSSDLAFVVEEGGRFIPREVTLGVKAGGHYQVKAGLHAGEKVVTAANFLIDSESRIKAVVRHSAEQGTSK